MAVNDDDLDVFIQDQSQDPAFAAAYADAEAHAQLLARCVELRKNAGLSQAEIARAMGTTQSAISDLEAGATDPRLTTMQRYVRAIGARLDLTLAQVSAVA